MTMIEKLNHSKANLNYLGNVRIYDKVDELVERINEIDEVMGMDYLVNLRKSFLDDKEEIYEMMMDITKQLKALQKIVAGDQLAKEINEGLDRVYGTTKEQEEDMLVPDEVEFVRFNKWEDSGIGLLFGNGQVLYLDRDVWYVDNINSGWRKVKCRLVPCNSLDLQAGDWFIQKKEDVSEVDNYYLYLGEGDHRTSKGAYACLHDGVSVYEIFGDMDGYKVQPIE